MTPGTKWMLVVPRADTATDTIKERLKVGLTQTLRSNNNKFYLPET